MNSTRVVPIIFMGSAIGAFKRGEDGLGTGLLCGAAFLLLLQWVLDEIDEARDRKRREQRSR